MSLPQPQRGELLTEVREGFAAIADVFRALRDTPPQFERAGAALDRLDAVIAALDEMQEQQEGRE
jgi:hypothetical protein